MKLGLHFYRAGFTLIELSIVVIVLGVITAAGLRYYNSQLNANNIAALKTTLDTIDTALFNFRLANGRLPCPADATQAENTATFGTEVDSSGGGSCTGYNYINATDPDGPSATCGAIPTSWTYGSCNPGAPDPNYDSTTLNQVVSGAVPTKALRLPDSYAYDPWGRKIWYTVDKRITATSAFTTYGVLNSTIGAIVIKNTETDLLANAVNIKGIYALVSAGPNGHGAFVRNASATSVRYNSGSTNIDEQNNCHCNNYGAFVYFDRIFVQKSSSTDPTTLTNSFDDIVRYKTRTDMATTNEMQ